MHILFIGAVVPENLCGKYKGCSVAGNKMQLGIVQALSTKEEGAIKVLSTYPIASYPKVKRLWMGRKSFLDSSKIEIISVSFVNLYVLKQITQALGVTFEIIKWRKSHKSEKDLILCFNACPERSVPLLIVSRLFHIRKFCIVADLPTNIKQPNFIKQISNYLQRRISKRTLKKFDGLIVLNEEVQKRYAPNLPFCKVDGGINLADFPDPIFFGGRLSSGKNSGKKVILYTGTLIEYNGILNLIKAIKHITAKDIVFKFYGNGPLSQLVQNESKIDERIQFGGQISNSEIIKSQRESSFLINPRPTTTELSQLTFPSKILEYMMSGIPVLSTRLNSLTGEYENLLIFIDDDPIAMARDIEQALKMDEDILVAKSKRAYQYVKKNKSWEVQAESIYAFLNEVYN